MYKTTVGEGSLIRNVCRVKSGSNSMHIVRITHHNNGILIINNNQLIIIITGEEEGDILTIMKSVPGYL